MLIQHLDQAMLWSPREIRDVSDFALKPLRSEEAASQHAAESLWQRPSQERVNNNKGEVGETFLKVTWSVLGRVGWGGLKDWREGCWRWEGEESGACCRRNRILSWPVWSQRRNFGWWLQLDAAAAASAGGVRWVGGWEGDSHWRTHSAF